jgi:DNA polymerase III epsilon subunit-like protein
MLTHVMIDLETWGTSPYSTIIEIGACTFDPYAITSNMIIADRFEVAIAPIDAGLRVDVETLMWWMAAERDAARAIWLSKPRVAIRVALDGFADWLRSVSANDQCTDVRMWGNGAGFDNMLLRQAYEMNSREAPWSFRHDRCFRTLCNLLTLEEEYYLGTAHTALADAENQAIRANQIVRKLGIKFT